MVIRHSKIAGCGATSAAAIVENASHRTSATTPATTEKPHQTTRKDLPWKTRRCDRTTPYTTRRMKVLAPNNAPAMTAERRDGTEGVVTYRTRRSPEH